MSLSHAFVVSVNISAGGIPKLPQDCCTVRLTGLLGDKHNHEKHDTPLQAISILDVEDVNDLRGEGFDIRPGETGENLTVQNLDVDKLKAGDRLRFSNGVEIELTKPRKPCYVLDAIDPRLKHAIRGRCGFLAKVITTGIVLPGETITVVSASSSKWPHTGAILAGGKSRRMGAPKQNLKLAHARTMIEAVAQALEQVCDRVVIVGDAEGLSGCARVSDLRLDAGPLGGIEALLASDLDTQYLICPCDLPLITTALLKTLAHPSTSLATVVRIENRDAFEPLPARVRAEALPMARTLLARGQRALWTFLQELQAETIVVPESAAQSLINVNTPHDLERVQTSA